MNRAENLERVRSRDSLWDIIVIGGGATGIGCAVDAASRGYDVLVLEQHDLGKGTSSRSTKLIHGGVRYLAQGDLSLVRESLKERSILLGNAPHVVHRQAFIVPCYSVWEKLYYGFGLKIYDLLAGKNSIGKSRVLSANETRERLPTVNPRGLSGGVSYIDGQFDDTRLLIDLAQTAASHGAAILNYAKVTSLEKGPDGKVAGVTFTDVETGEKFVAAAKTVINAAGAFGDAIRSMSDPAALPLLKFSRGIHLVFSGRFLSGGDAIMIPKTDDGRVLFCIPWHGQTLIGTTDTPVEGAQLEPEALPAEIDFVLDNAGKYLAAPPARHDILSVFAGIRPLVNKRDVSRTSSLSRSHDLFVDEAKLITMTGGKWTTYRRMGEDAVNKAVEIGGLEPRTSVTAKLTINPPLSGDAVDPGRIHPDLPYTPWEVLRAVRDEMARTVEDVLARRTRSLFLNAQAAVEIAPMVANIMATELGRDAAWQDDQVKSFIKTAEMYRVD